MHRQREHERQHEKEKGIQEHRRTKKETEEPRHIEHLVKVRFFFRERKKIKEIIKIVKT